MRRSGANGDETVEGKQAYKPDITSYDYSSPISEGGDHNIGADGRDLFLAVQQAIVKRPTIVDDAFNVQHLNRLLRTHS